MKKSILGVCLLSAFIASGALAAETVPAAATDTAAPVEKKEAPKVHKKKKLGANNQVHSKKHHNAKNEPAGNAAGKTEKEASK